MENIVCKSCGGSVTRQGNYYICDFCRSKWMIDSGNDVHAVERANAWEALRNNDFEKAAELFENIIVKDANNHEAFWGRALALNGIVYVTDYNENKKVPTCNNITEESFLKNKDVQKAISLAPADIKESYQKQAEQIEKIRVEWLDKASKEPAYDVFISFKDSDREHGIDRTQDSIDVQDLYTALVQKGYNVFFSRVTLRGKVSEQYEPYIYNALRTAKVMIVFGEKAEYFNAVWVKNEWSRFKTRIEKGEKHKNSLITVFKNVNPYDIPVALTGGRQAIDYSIPSNYEVLMNHIKRVIDESEQSVHLDRIQIKGGQMAKKSTKIQTETLQTRELGKGAIAKTSISEKQTLDLAHSYLIGKQWNDANKLLDDLLFNNPNLADAIWYKLQIKYQTTNDAELFKYVSDFKKDDYGMIVRFLNGAEKNQATSILNKLYKLCKTTSETTSLEILNTILPFNYDEREERISELFKDSIFHSRFLIFKTLLTTLNVKDVDTYIENNLQFAKKTRNDEYKDICVNNILSVDEGNVEALKMRLNYFLDKDDVKNAIKILETILKYSQDTKTAVCDLLEQIKKELNSNEDCLAIREVLKYYPGDLSEIKALLLSIAFVMINYSYFDHAKYFLSLILSVDDNMPKTYWGLCLVKTKSRSEAEIANSDVSLKQVPEYTKYLTMVNEARRQECFNIVKEQEKIQQKKSKSKKVKKLAVLFSIILSFAIASIIVLQSVVIPTNKYNKALDSLSDKDDVSAYQILSEIPTFKDSSTLILEIKERAKIKAKEYADNNDYESAYSTLETVGIKESEFSSMKLYKAMAEKRWGQAVEEGMYDLVIPEGVTEIKEEEFWHTPLKSIKIPNSVTSIGDSAFYWCDSLTSIEIPNSVTSIGEKAFYWCDSLTSVIIGDGVTSIGDSAFYWCDSLTSIEIPDSVTSIGESAFSSCDSLTSIEIPDSVTSIGENAFSGCYSITKVNYTGTIDDWLQIEFGGYASNPLYSGTNLYINNGLVTEIVLTKATKISNYAFNGCISLTSIEIPDSVTSIGYSAFNGCSSLTSIEIPDSVTSIGYSAFKGCTSLQEIIIPFIGASRGNTTTDAHFGYIFGANGSVPSSLEKVKITGSENIGRAAFDGCKTILSIEMPDGIISIGDWAFRDCDSLVIYSESKSAPYTWDYNWNYSDCPVVWNSKNNEIADDGYIYTTIDNVRYSLKGEKASVIQQSRNIKIAKIPKTITYKGNNYNVSSIEDDAFNGCILLESVIIGEGVTSIGDSAFYGCDSLTSVTIGNSVKSINQYAFAGCGSLKSIVIPESVLVMGYNVFYYCDFLKIYCKAVSKPNGWGSSWDMLNSSRRCPVVWGYKGN